MNGGLSWWQRGFPVTRAIVASNVIVFLIQCYFSYGLDSSWMKDTFALSVQGLKQGHYWQLLTHGWLHSEVLSDWVPLPLHILVNMMMVWFLGNELEWRWGGKRFLALYILGVIGAGVTFLAFNWHKSYEVIGASGAAFALLAAFAVVEPHRRLNVLIFFIIPIELQARSLAILVVIIELVCAVTGWFGELAHMAHVGGALVGFVFALLFGRSRRTSYSEWMEL